MMDVSSVAELLPEHGQTEINRTILMRDASFVIRPHTAASTSKGIANAFALVGELAGEQELSESLDHWRQLELNRASD